MEAEREAARMYEGFTARFDGDPELAMLWSDLAAEERRHARALAEWRSLLEREAPDHRPREVGFAATLDGIETRFAELRRRAEAAVSADEAFDVALELEATELDDLYAELLQSSPLHRYPDLELTRRAEIGTHREALVAAIRRRSTDESLRLRAELLALGG